MSTERSLKGGHDAVDAAQLAAVNQDTAHASGLPNQAYVSGDFAEFERDRLLARTWVCIGAAGALRNKGEAKPVSLLGLPLFMVRNGEALNVFHNVCSHRGHQLVNSTCRFKGSIRCPYHSWTYALDGTLRGTPHIGGPGVHEVDGFDPGRHGLKSVRSAQWMGLVFVNVSGDAPSLNSFLEPLVSRWGRFLADEDPDRLRLASEEDSFFLEIAANWKLAVENFCESYHLPWIHPGLNRYSRLEDHYHIMEEDCFAGQGTRVYDPVYRAGAEFPAFSGWPKAEQRVAEYVALFPNVLLGLHVDHFYAVVLIPESHNRTREEMHIFYLDDAADSETFAESRHTTREAWRAVFLEDVGVVEGMQRGRHSPAFTGGVFSPVMDPPSHCFHKWVANGINGR
ncbi:MAG: aromatic ring-hydroxylating dioxygenase subunit alpha [Gammaproteobacteria bacterium]|nr:aromatic ring-hydroxylating dioxygenase subunit alpha [Gammaproteobacteria bacterium]MDH3413375.1 aromatic ring-hydroxylating dioxygenase subunit alpha [Gammaproteobacteria bacterium]